MERAKIDKSKLDFLIAANADKFDATVLREVRETLSQMDYDQFFVMQTANFRDPTLMLLVSFFLGIDRFFLDDVPMGILKVLTCGGLGIWWLIDLFTVIDRTKRYNYNRFVHITSYMR